MRPNRARGLLVPAVLPVAVLTSAAAGVGPLALAADALTAPPCPLTDREPDVLRAAGPDTPVQVVARRLHLSAGAVRNHLASATGKLGAPSRAEAHRIARDGGWLT